MTNYNEKYECKECHSRGVKLWRDYNTCASVTDLLCATCCFAQAKASKYYSDRLERFEFFDFCNDVVGRGLDEQPSFCDQMNGMVPAVTTEEGDTFWGYSSVPSDRVLWWYSLPTYRDDLLKENACLKNIMLKNMKEASYFGKQYLEISRKNGDLRWKLARRVFQITDPVSITIFGSVSKEIEGGGTLRYGEDMRRELKRGERIAVERGRAVVLDGEEYRECPSIQDFDQDGDRLISWLYGQRKIFEVHARE